MLTTLPQGGSSCLSTLQGRTNPVCQANYDNRVGKVPTTSVLWPTVFTRTQTTLR
jgi:hypothetical protein